MSASPRAASAFEREAGEIPGRVAAQATQLGPLLEPLVERLTRSPPSLMATIARGSSENAAAFARYAVSLQLGLPAVSLPPSLASVYGRRPALDGALSLTVSQSGASPDLVLATRAAHDGGALCVGLLNEPGSLLAQQIDTELPIGAGPEHAIAATKSFVLSVTATLHLIARWGLDQALRGALAALPQTLANCRTDGNTEMTRVLARASHVFVVGRGPALPIARELALKLGEVAGLHARAHSAAELLHGPISLASADTPAIVLAGDVHSRDSVLEAAARLRKAGATVSMLGGEDGSGALPRAAHDLLQPLVTLYATYPLIARLARERGRDPDRPPHLEKHTRTR